MDEILAVGIGGFAGACARFGMTKFLARYPDFPLGTLFSNIAAGMLIGLIIGAERQTAALPSNLKLFLTTGFLGGLSTFSTFSLETVLLIESGQHLKAGINVLLNVGSCLAAVFVGLLITRLAGKLWLR